MVPVFADKVQDLLYRLDFRVTMGQLGSAVELPCGSSSIDDPKVNRFNVFWWHQARYFGRVWYCSVSYSMCVFCLTKFQIPLTAARVLFRKNTKYYIQLSASLFSCYSSLCILWFGLSHLYLSPSPNIIIKIFPGYDIFCRAEKDIDTTSQEESYDSTATFHHDLSLQCDSASTSALIHGPQAKPRSPIAIHVTTKMLM